jgi:hypothetical protein
VEKQTQSRVTPADRFVDELNGYKYESEKHPPGCICVHCVTISCILCNEDERVVWRGLPGFSRHVQYCHPKFWVEHHQKITITGKQRYAQNRSAGTILRNPKIVRQKISRAAQEFRAIEEISKASSAGLRVIPTKHLDDTTRFQVEKWIKGIKNLPKLRKRLFMEAVEKTEDKYRDEVSYRRSLKAIQMVIEESTALKKPTVVTHEVSFDPQVALEIVKLCWALNRGWSFVVHLLALYGLKSITENLHNAGISPPSTLSHLPMPSKIIAADESRVLSISRLLRVDHDPELEAYGSPEDEEFTSEGLFDEDLGETKHDREIHGEYEENE